jgi:tripartite-type tricarboxylate transporter receptor subunit TctC
VEADETRQRLALLGADPLTSTPEEYAAEIDTEETKWSAIVKSLNLKIE